MKKILKLLFILVFSTKIFAQLDREHWFAPMFDGQSNQTGFEQFLHLSTNETTPFNVSIYNNNILIEQVTISKGSPKVIDVPRDYIITSNPDDVFIVGTRGLYVKSDRPCFANLRFGVANHSEIITSKGTSGIGTEFYTVMAPNAQTSLFFGASVSILATEDNTAITISDFKKPIFFWALGIPSSITINLDKGQSYIADVRTVDAPENSDGFIGAKITSDKPISISNGNFNGQYASNTALGSDILMDQSVPVNKLGDEFVIVKGYGKIGNNMEGAIIVATQKNTSIYLNDSTTPIKILANEGDYYRVEETNYINRGNEHYNLHIKTNKNVYVYQLLGGVEAGESPLATGGMNYIPPLNCYLPRKIDEISYINYLSDQPHEPEFYTKLNIITEKGADVKVNGIVPESQYGPYDISTVTANQQWVTYSIPNVTGNITVQSTKAVTAGIASGNGAFGYGGYFAGFSSTPVILKVEGECLPGVKLAVTEGFDFYQWEIKNSLGNFVNAPVTSQYPSNKEFFYYPQQAGIYRVRIQQGSCLEVKTDEFKFYNCTTYTNSNYEDCSTVTIKPKFSLSTQTYNPISVKIDTPPSKGVATPQANGEIIYTANPGTSGIDTFKYSFCGIGSLPDCEVGQATVQINQVVSQDDILQECTSNGIAAYNLTKANVTADASAKKTYYKTANGALLEIASDEIKDFTSYSTSDTIVYVRIKNLKNCFAIQKIELKSKFYPVIKPTVSVEECDDDFDSVKLIQNLNNYKTLFTADTTVIAKFYTQLKDAQTDAANDISEIKVSKQQNLYVRFSNTAGCYSVVELIIKIKIPSKSIGLIDKIICPDTKTNLDAGLGFDKYEWFNATDSPIGSTQEIKDLEIGKYYVILTAPNGCTYKQNVEIKEAELPIIKTIEINENSVKINVEKGVKPYRYALDSGNYQDSNVFNNVSPGIHKVYVISADNCDPIEAEFSIIKIYNFITPNNDGYNDVLDMSLLNTKIDVKFSIHDRNGKKVFEGDENNKYIWDGKQNGRTLPTSSYWYIIEWKDFSYSIPVKYNGWILLKNRN